MARIDLCAEIVIAAAVVVITHVGAKSRRRIASIVSAGVAVVAEVSLVDENASGTGAASIGCAQIVVIADDGCPCAATILASVIRSASSPVVAGVRIVRVGATCRRVAAVGRAGIPVVAVGWSIGIAAVVREADFDTIACIAIVAIDRRPAMTIAISPADVVDGAGVPVVARTAGQRGSSTLTAPAHVIRCARIPVVARRRVSGGDAAGRGIA